MALTPAQKPHRRILSLALAGLVATSALVVTGAPAEAATSPNFQSFSSGSKQSSYYTYENGIDWSKPVGVVFYLDGDYWTTDQSKIYDKSNADLVAMAAEANSRNLLFVPVVSPDKDASGGGITWYEDYNGNGDWFRAFAKDFINRRGLDNSRVWTIGYSGGAEFEGLELGTDRQLSWRSGGGSIMVGGGISYGFAGQASDPNAKSLRFEWNVNYSDTYGATSPIDYSATVNAQQGYDYFRANGFWNTAYYHLNGSGHEGYNFRSILGGALNRANVQRPWWYLTHGAIGSYYNAKGGQNTFGLARTAEMKLRDDGVSQQFTKNYDIYWSPFTAAHAVNWSGAIGAKYKAGGYEATYGYPTNDERSINYGGAIQNFRMANGKKYAIYWSAKTGAHAVNESGDIGAHFKQNLWEKGWGFPTTDETGFWWGAKQHFYNTKTEKYTVAYWSAKTGTHTFNEKGAIFAKWVATGDAQGLGFPDSEETALNGGAQQRFYSQKTKKYNVVLWSGTTGAHSMVYGGAIYNAWQANGGVSKLGFPTTDEYTDASGVTHVKFSSGAEITWTAASGVKVTR